MKAWPYIVIDALCISVCDSSRIRYSSVFSYISARVSDLQSLEVIASNATNTPQEIKCAIFFNHASLVRQMPTQFRLSDDAFFPLLSYSSSVPLAANVA
jgi:hypothetical protein